MENLNYVVDSIIESAVTASRKLDAPPAREMRCSTVSKFCQIAFMLTLLENNLEVETFTKDFYCDVGTAVHSVMQKWLGITKDLYGMWQCDICKKINTGFGSIKCCENKLCIYKEYDLEWNGLKGHCDGLLLIDGEFYILELKTIGTKGLSYRNTYGPYWYHKNQANMYVFMGQKLKLPHPLVGYAIVYIERDDPNKFKSFVTKGIDFNSIKETVSNYKQAENMVLSGNFKNVIMCPNCNQDDKDRFCSYRDICSDNIEKRLYDLWKSKKEKT